MNNQIAYTVCCAWLARSYKRHTNPFVIERSKAHTRYLFFYDGEQLPFFTLHTCKDEGLIKEFVRFDDELRLHRVGFPVRVIGQNEYVKWDGAKMVYTIINRELNTFGLFLNSKPVGLLWD